LFFAIDFVTMQLKRRHVLFGLMGLAVPLVASSCTKSASSSSSGSASSASTEATNPEKIRIGYQVYAGSELLAKGLGLAQKTFPNSQVEYLRFDAGRDVNTALAAKGIDFGVLGSTAAAVGISSGLAYNIVYLYDLIGSAESLVVKSNIKTIADLKGKKIAVPFSSTSHYSLLSLLKLEGINQNELTILDMVPPDMLAAWQRGDIDGGYLWQPTLDKMKNNGGTILATSADLAKRGYATFDVAAVRTEFAQQYPGVLKQYVGMLNQATQLYKEKPQDAAKALAAELGVSADEALNLAKQSIWIDSSEQSNAKYLGTSSQPGAIAKALKDTADFMVAQKAIPTAPDQETYQKRILYL
jgi:taurine transport system substrate-binding protein